jgi:hypothetical protein
MFQAEIDSLDRFFDRDETSRSRGLLKPTSNAPAGAVDRRASR